MKKFNIKSYAAGLLTMVFLFSPILAFAETQQAINVIFGRIKLVVDGKPVEKETLLYNGTTYVPLRAAAEALGKEVGYDDATKTAYIGQIPATPKENPVNTPATSNQAGMEKDYLSFMLSLYDELLDRVAIFEKEGAKLGDNPMLIFDTTWETSFKKSVNDFAKSVDKLTSYDKAKVPDAYKEYHDTLILGMAGLKKGMDKLLYGVENMDLDAISESEKLLNEAMPYLIKADELFARARE